MEWKYCEQMLPKVSRTFALNIVKLDGDTYRAITISYLLFRIADTFEDNLYQKEDEKIKALHHLAGIFEGDKGLTERLNLYESLKFQWKEESSQKELVENGHRVLKCYFDLPSEYRQIIDPLLAESIEGMAKFQKKKLDSHSMIFQLQDIKDLEEYCYYVAGIVGMMLTRIFCIRKGISSQKSELEKYQVPFGLALQLTNILKDWQKDLNRGWCYIPYSITSKFRINIEENLLPFTPSRLGQPRKFGINFEEKLSPSQQIGIIKELIPWILTHFDSALHYIEIIPVSERSIRLFCIIPFVLAYHTLTYLIKAGVNKLPREEVQKILELSDDYANSTRRLKEDYLRKKAEIDNHLSAILSEF